MPWSHAVPCFSSPPWPYCIQVEPSLSPPLKNHTMLGPWWLGVKSALQCFNKYSWDIFLNIMYLVFIAPDGGVIKGKRQTVTSAVGQFTARVCVNFIILLLPIAKEWDTMRYYLSYNKFLGKRGRKHQQMLIIIRGQKYNITFYLLIRGIYG